MALGSVNVWRPIWKTKTVLDLQKSENAEYRWDFCVLSILNFRDHFQCYCREKNSLYTAVEHWSMSSGGFWLSIQHLLSYQPDIRQYMLDLAFRFGDYLTTVFGGSCNMCSVSTGSLLKTVPAMSSVAPVTICPARTHFVKHGPHLSQWKRRVPSIQSRTTWTSRIRRFWPDAGLTRVH